MILDPVRNKFITGSPEEILRQKIILFLTTHLGYPPHLIAVEKQLKSLLQDKNIFTQKIPNKRIDILIFSPLDSSLRYLAPTHFPQPLLILECKTTSLNKKALLQLIGYNNFIQAPCIGLVNSQEILLGVLNLQTKKYEIMYNFLSFNYLVQLYCKNKKPCINNCDPSS